MQNVWTPVIDNRRVQVVARIWRASIDGFDADIVDIVLIIRARVQSRDTKGRSSSEGNSAANHGLRNIDAWIRHRARGVFATEKFGRPLLVVLMGIFHAIGRGRVAASGGRRIGRSDGWSKGSWRRSAGRGGRFVDAGRIAVEWNGIFEA